MRLLFRISVLFVLGQLLYKTVTQRCGSEISIFGWMLRGHIYSTMLADLPHTCVQVCREDDRCQSFNWVISLLKCEFSNRTKEARPEDFISDPDRFYYKRDRNRVPLGSIPELPAETCLEIKKSEGHAISRKYWFSSIKTGTSVLAYCDMKTEDIDECSTSSHSCDINTVCSNTVGSYVCACKAGFTGDGNTCTDIDECSRGTHNCHSSLASCTNIAGSFSCSCNNPYSGDGRTCYLLVSECQNYGSLNSADRKITYSGITRYCDNGIGPGWFRFEGSAGTRMATSCPPYDRCGTRIPGWMNGRHPTVADGQVTRTECFHYGGNCCVWSRNIKVRNCGSYYVYYLSGTPTCALRYCGTN